MVSNSCADAKRTPSRPVNLTVVGARHLYKRDIFRSPDTIAIVTVDGGQMRVTQVKKRSLNPAWNQSFLLDVTDDSVITVEVYDQSKLAKKNRGFLGIVRVSIQSLFAESCAETCALDLQATELSKSVRGQLIVSVTYTDYTPADDAGTRSIRFDGGGLVVNDFELAAANILAAQSPFDDQYEVASDDWKSHMNWYANTTARSLLVHKETTPANRHRRLVSISEESVVAVNIFDQKSQLCLGALQIQMGFVLPVVADGKETMICNLKSISGDERAYGQLVISISGKASDLDDDAADALSPPHYIPNEIIDYIIRLSDDDAALVALACVSRRLRNCVVSHQKMWRSRFMLYFPPQTDRELAWMRLHTRMHLSTNTRNNQSSARASNLRLDAQPNWFEMYCSRRTAEHRWRYGQYTTRLLANAATAPSNGVRLQSVPYARADATPCEAVVATQWLSADQQQPMWTLEEVCWDGVDVQHANIRNCLWSAEHLVISLYQASEDALDTDETTSVYAWHFNALHRPPRAITASRKMYPIAIHREWLLFYDNPSGLHNRGCMSVYSLAKHACYTDILGTGVSVWHVQSTTPKGMRIFWIDRISETVSPVQVPWKLWEFDPDSGATSRCMSNGKTLIRGTWQNLRTLRVDDSRLVLYSVYQGESPADATPAPTLVLLASPAGNAGTLLEKRWSLDLMLDKVVAIVAHNRLLAKQPGGFALLSLSDGTRLYNTSTTTLRRWYDSAFYPPKHRWITFSIGAPWQRLYNDPELGLSPDDTGTAATAAALFSVNGAAAVIDYTI
ncbi:hypothetical protein THASP1DRAFT_28551 [Thamnocephalis sphaerospora]|uniref:C2 domain-containing protein n=1 Tax=Thamnocephalis sphaerospora TaxID=78915 RepID=A0A4P9XTZ1_9FUNG|nr:hypothetical protein THASP1DRAFT_28551 [Thamnocephalis sphaerospora]|eukprot:RKP09668.1 hypothetical protein THASP1DRAFT_28551 [Thamnocephalis sphaerospora]